MKKKVLRVAAKKAAPSKVKKAPVRRLVLKAAPAEAMTADEVSHLETLVKRFEDSERLGSANGPDGDADPWTQVEAHAQRRRNADRR